MPRTTHSPQRPAVAPLAVRLACAVTLLAIGPAAASSHREAPFVTEHPKVDATDFYAFRSYEPGRAGFVTLIANYMPLQDAYGGPNYFAMDPEAVYEIHVDRNGNGRPALTFEFRFERELADIQIPVGGVPVSIPLSQAGQVTDPASEANLNVRERYSVRLRRGGQPAGQPLRDAATGSVRFAKPMDNIGAKTFPDYESYAARFVYDVEIPGCDDGRLFVGQRNDPFAVNLGEIFDLVNIADPIGPPDAEPDTIADKNVTSLVLEVPIGCLTGGTTDVVGAWTTARLPTVRSLRSTPTFDRPELTSQQTTQVSRLGMPLVNEVVIGLKDKDRFNASSPRDDRQFAHYVTHPTLPELLEILFGAAGVRAPDAFPRQDLVAAFVTGIPGLNQLGFGEMLRLNVTIPPAASADQNDLGVIAGDAAGFPNGRRPGDDVVDIELRVAMGLLCHAFPGAFGCGPADAPSGLLPFTDGTRQPATAFDEAFPYLTTPIPGSPN